MSGLDRYLTLLELFGEATPALTVAEMAEGSAVPASSVYRAVRDLVAAGLLDPADEARYRLGARFLEFDRLVRLTDPLVVEGAPILRDVVAEARIPCVAIAARLFGDRVMCVASERGDEAGFRTSYERGRPMPLLRGATSKTILAQLPLRRLTRLLDARDGAAAPMEPGAADAFRAELLAIRKRGFCISRGEVDTGLVGLAVPIASPEAAITASLSLIAEGRILDPTVERRLVMMLVASGSLLDDALGRHAAATRRIPAV